jgi:hypothetical protein
MKQHAIPLPDDEYEEIQMQHCPACGSDRVHRSRSNTLFERLRKFFSSARPHRCRACGWRGWIAVTDSERHETRFAVDCEPLDLTALDERLSAARRQDTAAQKAEG